MADPAPGISATSHEDNLRYFDVVIAGPNQSPFQGNSFIHKDVQGRMCDAAEAVMGRLIPRARNAAQGKADSRSRRNDCNGEARDSKCGQKALFKESLRPLLGTFLDSTLKG